MWHRIGKEGNRYWGMQGAGMLFTDGHVFLLLKRSGKGDNAGTWSAPGGRLEDNETFIGAAQRETKEEIGHLPHASRITDIETKDGRHTFKTYVCAVPHQFACKLTDEHDDYGWFDQDAIKKLPLHPKLSEIMPSIIQYVQGRKSHTKNEMSGFAQFCNFAEMMGSTAAIYTGEKEGPDWQYQGAPESMVKPKKRKKKS